jgi:DNA repair protein RecO (recombination protein O)
MPLNQSESLVLKSYNLAEADRIVVFLTREYGIVRGVAKGARRLKSKFGSTLELFTTINLTYFEKEDRELVSVQQVDIVRSLFAEASKPEFLGTFSYIADLLTAFVPPHDPNEKLYRMVKACTEASSGDPTRLAAIRLYFELWLLRLGGYLPDWTVCANCKNSLDSAEYAFLRHDHHLICGNCRDARGNQTISAAQRQVFHNVQKLSPVEFAASASGVTDEVHVLSTIAKRVISQVIGREVSDARQFR